MNSKTKKIVILLILGLVFPLILNYNFNFSNTHKPNIINPKSSGAYIESFIHIDGSIPNNWSWTAGNYSWCYGDGSWGNPYIIENVTIDGTGREFGILINNSKNDYFIIRNCTVYNVGLTPNDGAILLVNVSIGNIMNNNCSFNVGCGINLDTNCNNNTISGNTVNDNQPNTSGINLNQSDNNTISGNTANGNGNSGIYIGNSDYNTLLGNTLEGNDFGVWMNGGDNNYITGNTANGNDIGLGYEYGENNTFSGNTVNNNTFSGIYVSQNCNNNTISGNTANNNSNYGIYFDHDSNNNIITGNTANYNQDGIYLEDSDDNTVSGNTANDNDYGIYLYVSHSNLIVMNNLNDNLINGMRLYGDEGGCDDNIMAENLLYNNGVGLYFKENCNQNNITKNILNNNTLGIILDHVFCANNLIFENFFLNNGKHADDDGTDNKWNNTIIGNYWDNHTGPDLSPLDGIVDTPYAFIGGSSGSIDYLPIAEDGVPEITINAPSSGSKFTNTAPSFNVVITDAFLFEMFYTLDGGLHNYTFTENGTINQSAWDEVPDGDVIITFYAVDMAGNIGTAEITVSKNLPEEFDPTLLIVIVSVIGGVVLLGVILIILEKKGKISLDKLKGLLPKRK